MGGVPTQPRWEDFRDPLREYVQATGFSLPTKHWGLPSYSYMFLPDLLLNIPCVVYLGADQLFMRSPADLWRDTCQPRNAGGNNISVVSSDARLTRASAETAVLIGATRNNDNRYWRFGSFKKLVPFLKAQNLEPYDRLEMLGSGSTAMNLEALRVLDYKKQLYLPMQDAVKPIKYRWGFGDQDLLNVVRMLWPHRVSILPANWNLHRCASYSKNLRRKVDTEWYGVIHENCQSKRNASLFEPFRAALWLMFPKHTNNFAAEQDAVLQANEKDNHIKRKQMCSCSNSSCVCPI